MGVKSFEKYANIMLSRNFLKKSFEIFENFPEISNKFVFRPNAGQINAWFVKILDNVFENFRKMFPLPEKILVRPME